MEVLEKVLREYEEKPIIGKAGVVEFNIRKWYCGTAACAAGIACMLPEFQKEGLRLSADGCFNDEFPIFREFMYVEAMQHVLDITFKQTRYLFDPMAYSGKVLPIDIAIVTGKLIIKATIR